MLLQARTGASTRARSGRWPAPFGASAEIQILVGLTVLAAVVRFATLGSQSYWLDESQAAHELGLSFHSMLHAWSSVEGNPPLYLLIGWPWAKLFGTGEAGVRSLSALLGVGLVPLLYLCGRELTSSRAGLLTGAMAAVNPMMIWYSQEAREYMLLVVLCAASLLFFARAWRTHSARDLTWWAVLSALAILSQYFAGFLVAAEALLLLYRCRSRASLIAVASQAVVVAALTPHLIPFLRAPELFITSQPFSARLQQVPVEFAFNTLYRTPLVSYGLLGAAALTAAVIALLVVGGDDRELRGAGLAAVLAGAVLLVPLGLALAGHDDYIARALMPAWPPLAIVIATACTTRGARVAGAALAAVVLGSFVLAQIKISDQAAYQRPNWRGVVAALGTARGARAIVAYDGSFATGPLSFYLPRVSWAGPGAAPGANAGPATISELDVVGDAAQELGSLPDGVRLIGERRVDGYQVDRFALAAPWRATVSQIQSRAVSLLAPAPAPTPPVLFQRASA
jgi:hypothetical protein